MGETNGWRRWIGGSAPALLWVWLFFHLHYTWSLNAQYNYGWAVPFLAALLVYLKWPERPAIRPKHSPLLTVAGCLLLSLLLPLRVVEEANPDWRLLGWTLALVVIAYSLLWLIRIGGTAWARHFAFPTCFPLVAVPWPMQFENLIVQRLTRAVAFAAVEIASWIGVGAIQLGNVIELHNGFVGVDEACSGVKTLQAAIMVTLVLGGLLQLTFTNRLALLVGGCVWVFVCNIMRATMLVIIAAQQGKAELDKWHDLIGTAVLILGMAGLLALGWMLGDKRKRVPVRALTDTRSGFGDQESPAARTGNAAIPSFSYPVVALPWLLLVFASTEFWYRAHERQLTTRPAWEAHWPEGSAAMPIADAAAEILRYDEATSAAWDSGGASWWGFFGRWEPRRTAVQLVRSHSPEICLPAVGRTFRGELAPAFVESDALPVAFRAFEFMQNGRPLFVFVCIQEDKTATDLGSPSTEWNAAGRLRAAWHGQRNMGQRLLELAVVGLPNIDAARDALRQTVGQIVRPNPTTD